MPSSVYRKVAANLYRYLTPAHREALAKIKKQAKR